MLPVSNAVVNDKLTIDARLCMLHKYIGKPLFPCDWAYTLLGVTVIVSFKNIHRISLFCFLTSDLD